jgi:hypothetical protein
MSTGIRKRGSSYEASVWVARDDNRIRKSFPTLKEAKAWRATTTDRVNAGTVRASSATTLPAGLGRVAQGCPLWIDPDPFGRPL